LAISEYPAQSDPGTVIVKRRAIVAVSQETVRYIIIFVRSLKQAPAAAALRALNIPAHRLPASAQQSGSLVPPLPTVGGPHVETESFDHVPFVGAETRSQRSAPSHRIVGLRPRSWESPNSFVYSCIQGVTGLLFLHKRRFFVHDSWSKPSSDALTKSVYFIGATCLYSLIRPRTTLLSMSTCRKQRRVTSNHHRQFTQLFLGPIVRVAE